MRLCIEGTQILSGATIQKTIIFPFVKMLENHCTEITAEEIRKKMWEKFSKEEGKDVFIENAGKLLQPYKITDEKTER